MKARRRLLQALVSAAVLAALCLRLDGRRFLESLSRVPPGGFLLLGVSYQLLSTFLFAAGLHALLRRSGARLLPVAAAGYKLQVLSAVVPGRIADLGLHHLLRGSPGPGACTAAVVVDKLVTLGVAVVLGAAAVGVLFPGAFSGLHAALLAAVAAGGAALAAFLVASSGRSGFAGRALARLGLPFEGSRAQLLATLRDARALVLNLLWTLARLALAALTFHTVLGWLGARVPLGQLVLVMSLVQLLGVVPISFMGIGVVDAANVALLGRLGAPPEPVVAAGVLGSGLGILVVLALFGLWTALGPSDTEESDTEESDTTERGKAAKGRTPMRRLLRLWRAARARMREQKLGALLKYAELKLLGPLASARAARVPSKVFLELTGRCNLSCTYCSLDDLDYRLARKGDLELDKALQIIRQLRGVKVLMLYGIGEPLLYRELEVVIREARRIVPVVCFTTNGVLLTPDRSLSLAAAGLSRLHVSLDSLDPQYHRRIRGGDLHRILSNLEFFSRRTGLPVHLWTVVHAGNVGHAHELADLKARLPTLEFLHFQLLEGEHLRDRKDLEARIPAPRMRAFKERTLRRCEELRLETDVSLLPDEPPTGHTRGLCFQPWTGSTFINYQGKLAPCCVLPEVGLEDVLAQGFRQAWNGPSMQEFRRQLQEGNYLPTCQDSCGFRCNGRNPFHHLNERPWDEPRPEPELAKLTTASTV